MGQKAFVKKKNKFLNLPQTLKLHLSQNSWDIPRKTLSNVSKYFRKIIKYLRRGEETSTLHPGDTLSWLPDCGNSPMSMS